MKKLTMLSLVVTLFALTGVAQKLQANEQTDNVAVQESVQNAGQDLAKVQTGALQTLTLN